METINLNALSLEQIAIKCRQEDEKFHNGRESDPRYCYELFRKAFVDKSQAAWNYVYTQFNPQMLRWIRAQQGVSGSGEDAEYFVNRGFEKFWLQVQKKSFLEAFPKLGKLLNYLRMCLVSEYIDYLRANKQPQLQIVELGIEENVETVSSESFLPEAEVAEADRAERLTVWVQSQLKNEKEQIVVERAFFYGQSAAEIFELHGELFSDVKEVYRVKENLLRRIRRALEKEDTP